MGHGGSVSVSGQGLTVEEKVPLRFWFSQATRLALQGLLVAGCTGKLGVWPDKECNSRRTLPCNKFLRRKASTKPAHPPNAFARSLYPRATGNGDEPRPGGTAG